MPVQINEVIIRAVVENNPASSGPVATGVRNGNGSTDFQVAALVLEIIKEKNER